MPVSDTRIWDGTSWISLRGPTGNTGAPGVKPVVTVAATGLPAGSQPTVTDSNPDTAIANLTFGIPAGAAGAAATIAVGTTTAGAAPAVTNSGTSSAAVFNFVLQKGDKGDAGSGVTIKGTLAGTATALPASPAAGDMYILGTPVPTAAPSPAIGVKADGDGITWTGAAWTNVGPIKGPKGDTGATGNAGTNATVSVGTVTTGAAGSAVVITDGDASANGVILNMTIPRGDKGEAGKNNEVYTNVAATPPAAPGLGAIWLVN